MNWERLRADEMPDAVKRSGGLCVIPIGCTEKHGVHLPLGTDVIEVKTHVELAAQIEEVVIFPVAPWLGDMTDNYHLDYFTRNHGCVALSPETLLKVLEELCDEIARNGFTKILFVNCHGGNMPMLDFFLRCQCYKKKSYATMTANSFDKTITSALAAYEYFKNNRADYPMLTDSDMEVLKTYADYPDGYGGGHGDFFETACVMGAEPELVNSANLDAVDGMSTGRTYHLKDVDVKIAGGWQANHPNALSGRPSFGCTQTIGEAFNLYCGRRVAKMLKVIKEDKTCLDIVSGK